MAPKRSARATRDNRRRRTAGSAPGPVNQADHGGRTPDDTLTLVAASRDVLQVIRTERGAEKKLLYAAIDIESKLLL